MTIDQSILIRAIEKWGAASQLEMVKEECLELALALQKLNRIRNDREERHDAVIDEIADVIIMIEQVKLIFPIEKINERIEFKINRLEERISK